MRLIETRRPCEEPVEEKETGEVGGRSNGGEKAEAESHGYSKLDGNQRWQVDWGEGRYQSILDSSAAKEWSQR